jgi:hypothetical protein
MPPSSSRKNTNSKPRGPSLVCEAEETAAEVEATLASYTTSSNTTSAPLVRPSSATSSLATEYYGRPLHSASTAARSAEAAAAPATDRLYADHFRKQAMLDEQRRIRDLELQLATQQVYCTPVSRALAAHRTAGGYSSYGARLYAEGRLEALKREAEIAQIRAQEAEDELAGATFRPQISKLARNLKFSSAAAAAAAARARGSAASNNFAAPWDRLHNQGSALKKERRAEAIRKELEEEELKECSFKPRVDRNSARLVQERRGIAVDSGLPLYQRLYNEGLCTKEKKEETALMWLPDDATFKPKVNTSSVVMTELMAAAEGDVSGALARDVSERLLLRGKWYQEKLESARQASIAPVDADGRLLFQPKTLRAPRGVDRSGPIGEHLYTAALQSSAKAEAQAEAARKQALHQAASVHVNTASIRMMERLQRERLSAIFSYLARVGPSEMIPMDINLLEVVHDEEFMDTIDPEVRADVEHAARILRKTILTKQQVEQQQNGVADDSSDVHDAVDGNEVADGVDNNNTGGEENWALKALVSSSATTTTIMTRAGSASIATEREAAWSMSQGGEVTESGFIALMSEVLDRTRGIARQYLLPLPSTRRKWEEPTFKPTIEPRSLALAARTRPEGLPAHEILYRTAQETAEKKELARREQEAAILRECSFQPAFVAAQNLVSQGRALKMASQPPVMKHTLTKEEVEARREQEELLEIAQEAEHRKKQSQQQQHDLLQRRGFAARGSSAVNHTTLDGKNSNVVPLPSTTPFPLTGNTAINVSAASAFPTTANGDNSSGLGGVPPPANGNTLEDGIDAIERQIQEAMARLSMTGESFIGHLQDAAPPLFQKSSKNLDTSSSKPVFDIAASCSAVSIGGIPSSDFDILKGGAVVPQDKQKELNNAARLRASLDYDALFGSEGAAGLTTPASISGFSGTGEVSEQYNPMRDGLAPVPTNVPAAAADDDVKAVAATAGRQAKQIQSLLAQLAAEPLPADLVECTGSSC